MLKVYKVSTYTGIVLLINATSDREAYQIAVEESDKSSLGYVDFGSVDRLHLLTCTMNAIGLIEIIYT